jgi:hypothetical protein
MRKTRGMENYFHSAPCVKESECKHGCFQKRKWQDNSFVLRLNILSAQKLHSGKQEFCNKFIICFLTIQFL